MDGKANKRLGQHFLVSSAHAERIVRWAGIRTGDPVLEIGPGRGALTDLLLGTGCRLTAIEIDTRWVEELRAHHAGHPGFRLIHGDFLSIDPSFWRKEHPADSSWKVVSNLPYNQATVILQKLAQLRRSLKSVTVMVQKEVGERLLAGPHNREIGWITHALGYHFSIQKGFFVPPGAFLPPPKVTSLVIQLTPRETDTDFFLERSLRRILEVAFSARRKQLHKNLSRLGFSEPCLQEIFGRLGIRPDARAEDLTTEDFCRLAGFLYPGNS